MSLLVVTYQDMLDTVPPIKSILVALNPCGRCSDSNPGSISDVVARRCCLDGNDTAPLDIFHVNKLGCWVDIVEGWFWICKIIIREVGQVLKRMFTEGGASGVSRHVRYRVSFK